MPQTTITSALATLRPHDATVISFALLLSLLNAVFHARIPEWWILIIVNLACMLGVLSLAYLDALRKNAVVSFIHLWYPAPLIFVTFKELYLMIYPVHGRDYDGLFIAIDRWLFGVDPTVWIGRFAHPLLTEILQIAYTSFYVLLMIIAYELWKKDRERFLFYAFMVVYGFFLSYIGYFLLPAVGPRFTLHDFDALDIELPGLLLTGVLRDFVNAGESIPAGVPNPIEHAQRDVFPSGHTMMMLVMMHVAVRYRMKVRWFILVAGVLLIFGTVYLRYHYVIDLYAGALFYGLCMWTAPPLYRTWEIVRSRV